ncbi:hypothetical protein MSKOL_3018 [Methanosarcina sp. Kolksee]|nr:hypothetical protein MSKOL_3018 [Methanosarcina sp. Kolksee]MCC4765937.1 hypothetical protein [Methanosarcina sp. DH1]
MKFVTIPHLTEDAVICLYYGKRGRPKKPEIVLPDYLNYAQVVKIRTNGVLKKVEKMNHQHFPSPLYF